ncbi:MAG: hypothetical protein EOP06_00420 [Proteobacteria bacterium]|nr:MAG: hypothetical protein EOP06_00420 [Pseudomonadota bacterium]
MGEGRTEAEIQFSEDTLASVVNFLLEGKDVEAAAFLAISECWFEEGDYYDNHRIYLTLYGSRQVVEAFEDGEHGLTLYHAIKFVCNTSNIQTSFRANRIKAQSGWRKEALDRINGKSVNNQAAGGDSPIHFYENNRFRSVSEIKLAQELDRRKITYFPNCRARSHYNGKVGNVEPDFLIVHEGKCGIIEVDGDFFHKPDAAVKEHARDRAFRSKGLIVERFPSKRCYETPAAVIDEFLSVLTRA